MTNHNSTRAGLRVSRRHRGWLLALGIAVCGAAAAVVTAHHYAPLYAPALVIAWSPSPDHVTRAIQAQLGVSPAGYWPEEVRARSARLSASQLARVCRGSWSGAWRAGVILGARIDQPGDVGDAARAVVGELLETGGPEAQVAVLEGLPSGAAEVTALVATLIDHPHPDVAAAATWAIARSHVQPLPAEVVCALRRELDYRSRCEPSAIRRMVEPWLGHRRQLEIRMGYRRPGERMATDAERVEAEAAVADAAWRALCVREPATAIVEGRSRWTTLGLPRQQRILRDLADSRQTVAIPFLVELAEGDGVLAATAPESLARLGGRGCRQPISEPARIASFLALVDLSERWPARRDTVAAAIDQHGLRNDLGFMLRKPAVADAFARRLLSEGWVVPALGLIAKLERTLLEARLARLLPADAVSDDAARELRPSGHSERPRRMSDLQPD